MERRKASRFALRVPVLFTWDGGHTQQAGGFTRDVSAYGAYVLCEKSECPAQGDTVTIQLLLPSVDGGEPEGLKLRAEGLVLRTGECQQNCGFAVLADFGKQLNGASQNTGQSGVRR